MLEPGVPRPQSPGPIDGQDVQAITGASESQHLPIHHLIPCNIVRIFTSAIVHQPPHICAASATESLHVLLHVPPFRKITSGGCLQQSKQS